MLPNHCLHRGQTRTGSDRFQQRVTCQTCQMTLIVIWKGVDACLVDLCLSDASWNGIYSAPEP
eukprot:5993961-Prorocentrum_lima.AAC.1